MVAQLRHPGATLHPLTAGALSRQLRAHLEWQVKERVGSRASPECTPVSKVEKHLENAGMLLLATGQCQG